MLSIVIPLLDYVQPPLKCKNGPFQRIKRVFPTREYENTKTSTRVPPNKNVRAGSPPSLYLLAIPLPFLPFRSPNLPTQLSASLVSTLHQLPRPFVPPKRPCPDVRTQHPARAAAETVTRRSDIDSDPRRPAHPESPHF